MPGPTELALLLVIVLIVFGAGRLPQVFEALGDGVKKFRDAQREDKDPPRDVEVREASKPMLEKGDAHAVADAEEVKQRSA